MRPLLPPRKQASKVVEKRGGKGSFSSSSDQKLPSLLATSSVLPPSSRNQITQLPATQEGDDERGGGGGGKEDHFQDINPEIYSPSPSPLSLPRRFRLQLNPPSPPPPPSLHHHQVNRVCHSTQGGRKERGRRKKLIGYASSPTFSTLQLLADFICVCIAKKKAWIILVCFLQTCGTKIFLLALILGECRAKKSSRPSYIRRRRVQRGG